MNHSEIALFTDLQYDRDLEKIILDYLPDGNFSKILLKPNWVKHEENPEFPITALVTHVRLIESVINACSQKYRMVQEIIVGDIPLQSCDWDALIRQSGVDSLIEKYSGSKNPAVIFADLRKERWHLENGFMIFEDEHNGDPSGYVEINVDDQSLLEEISHNAERFRVSDYDPKETVSVHKQGHHRYLISKTILEADLVINLPKMKTHQKSGITGALKNLVGINGSKAYLVHHQLGKPSDGGDEFPDNVPWLLLLQVRLREIIQKRSRWIFKIFKIGWELLKKLFDIQTQGTPQNLQKKNFYVGAGSWHGNDSIWRMVYDLNKIILYGGIEGGTLKTVQQREYIAILDGILAGEGNGPLQPIPVETNVMAISRNPFLIDFCMAKMMGFDPERIPLLSKYKRFDFASWHEFTPHGFDVILNGQRNSSGIESVPVIKDFIPPPGWKSHIEIEKTGQKSIISQ